MADTKNVGLFLLLPAPLNPIGAFDAETFKANFRSVIVANSDAKFIGVDLSGIDFVYSDAYNAFMQFHQELSKRNGVFAVLADKESLAKSLKKVGLERFVRIFSSEADMASYATVEQKAAVSEPSLKPETILQPETVPQPESVPQPQTPAPAPAPVAESKPQPVESKILDKNPLEDEPSSKSSVVVVILLLLIVIAVVSYLVM